MGTGHYVCDFNFFDTDKYLTHPILVQAIYPDGSASKEKFVVTTYKGLRPESGKLVEKGLGITLSAHVLNDIKNTMAQLVTDAMPSAKIISLTPAANESPGDKGIFHLDLKMSFIPFSFDLALNDTVKTSNGQDVRKLTIGLEDISGGKGSGLMDMFLVPFMNFFLDSLGLGDMFINLLNLNEIPVMPVAFPLADMLSGFTNPGKGAEEDPMAALLENLQLDSTLFLNVYGLPEKTDSQFATIGAGLYAADTNFVETDQNGNLLWPEVVIDDSDTLIDFKKIKTETTDFGLAMSQYNLNQMLSQMMNSFSIVMKDIQNEMPMFAPEDPNNSMDIAMTINPAGIAIEMKSLKGDTGTSTARIAISDMNLELVEADEPKAELSMDLNLLLDLNIRTENGDVFLDIQMTPDEDLCYLHVMKDTMGLDIFDHSRLVTIIFGAFTGSSTGEIAISMPLSDMGLSPREGVEDGGAIEFDENGNCFMNLAVGSVDASAILGEGACFISSAR